MSQHRYLTIIYSSTPTILATILSSVCGLTSYSSVYRHLRFNPSFLSRVFIPASPFSCLSRPCVYVLTPLSSFIYHLPPLCCSGNLYLRQGCHAPMREGISVSRFFILALLGVSRTLPFTSDVPCTLSSWSSLSVRVWGDVVMKKKSHHLIYPIVSSAVRLSPRQSFVSPPAVLSTSSPIPVRRYSASILASPWFCRNVSNLSPPGLHTFAVNPCHF